MITLRDLFKWAARYSHLEGEECEDWKQYLAEQGLLILTAKCRAEQDVLTIHACIEKVFARKLDISNLKDPRTFSPPIMNILNEIISFAEAQAPGFVWTSSARRLSLLVGLAYKFNEPFLLVGDTGIGKTTICQLLAQINQKRLHIMNCHMHSEAADFLGSIRPARSEQSERLFEWHDGPLVEAMRLGHDFLIDEISLADDSVLERLNSVLEEERTLLLDEHVDSTAALLIANPAFRIFATMNPGGDFGKKELSPALRNRFTEIWCPSPTPESEEFRAICRKKLLKQSHIDEELKEAIVNVISSFLKWLGQQSFFARKSLSAGTISIRDLGKWVDFINTFSDHVSLEMGWRSGPILALIHGACLVFIDAVNVEEHGTVNPAQKCLDTLYDLIGAELAKVDSYLDAKSLFESNLDEIQIDNEFLQCGPFKVSQSKFFKQNLIERLSEVYGCGTRSSLYWSRKI